MKRKMYFRKKGNKYHNKKVKVNGLSFDSKIEYYFHSLINGKLDFEFQKKIELQKPFIHNGKKIRSINIIVDFYIKFNDKVVIVDTKGMITPVAKLKLKMLSKKFVDENIEHEIFLPNSKKKCLEVYQKLKSYG